MHFYIFYFTVIFYSINENGKALCDINAATKISIYTTFGWGCMNGYPNSNFCDWPGVHCSVEGTVNGLSCETAMIGTLPSSLGQLDSLTMFNCSGSSIYGKIPSSIGMLQSLKALDVYSSKISGTLPTTLGMLRSLTRLDVSYSTFSGTIPSELVYLTNLKYLNIAGSLFSGSLPNEIGQISSLVFIDASSTKLTGSVPSTLCGNNLTYLQLTNSNNFNCYANCLSTINSHSYGSLTTCDTEYFKNQFDVKLEIDTDINSTYSQVLCDFQAATNIKDIIPGGGWICVNGTTTSDICSGWDVIGCSNGVVVSISFDASYYYLTGTIPSSIGKLTGLTHFQISQTLMYGTVPSSIGLLTNLQYYKTTYAYFSGTVPTEIGLLSSLTLLDIYYSFYYGWLPSSIINLVKLQFLHVSLTFISGPIPTGISQLLLLTTLDVSSTYMYGSIPSEIGLLTSLTLIEASKTYLGYHLPTTIAYLTNLKFFSIYNSYISGTIPTEIGRLSLLTYLDVSLAHMNGSLPSEFGHLTNLKFLHGAYNSFSGSLPTTFGLLLSLTELGFSSTSISGSLPTLLGYLTNLESLYMDSTLIFGTIPTSLTYLTSLTSLKLQYTSINGTIPTSFASLYYLQELQLQDTHLTGSIPNIIGWQSLSYLDISYTSITGSIPSVLCGNNLMDLFVMGCSFLNCYAECLSSVATSSYDTLSICSTAPTKSPTSRPTRFRSAYPSKLPVVYVAKSPTISPTREATEYQNITMCDFAAATSISKIVASGWFCNNKSSSGTSNTDICGWLGVGCDTSNQVIKIDLSALQGITGTLPSSIHYLQSLVSLRLGNNSFSSSIPTGFGLLSNLTYLNVSYNQLTGPIPSELGKTPLKELIINNNYFTGSLPSGLCHNTYLSHLSIVSNDFSCINSCLFSVTTMSYSSSLFTCTAGPTSSPTYKRTSVPTTPTRRPSSAPSIPTITPTTKPSGRPTSTPTFIPTTSPTVLQDTLMCDVATAITIGLAYSGWKCSNGKPTDSICNIWSGIKCIRSYFISEINLSQLRVSGSISSSIGGILTLSKVDLSSNKLNGVIPSILGSLPSLSSLKLSSNSLRGSLPTVLGTIISLTTLDVSSNKLNGTIPSSFQFLTNVKEIVVNSNLFTGSLPSKIGGTSLSKLSLQSNSLTGGIPSSLCSSNNFKAGSIAITQNKFTCCPACVVTASLSYNCTSLLTCTSSPTSSPTSVPSMPTVIPISSPSVVPTFFPSSVPTASPTDQQSDVLCDFIAVTDLRKILSWTCTSISDYCSESDTYSSYLNCDSEQKITTISLGSVGITGTIPSSLGYLWSLTYLDLSYNSLSSSIPSSLGGITRLQYLILNYNNLTGVIPSSFGELSSILRLELPENHFTGTIPSTFGNLITLTYLDLSYNSISGTIPYLGDFYLLTSIQVQSNRLIGSLPASLCISSLKTLSAIENHFVCYASCLTTKKNLLFDERTKLPGCTSIPSSLPTATPTVVPSTPTSTPTIVPSTPTVTPTSSPTSQPSVTPTIVPSMPTSIPTTAPTKNPGLKPTTIPTSLPTVTEDTVLCDFVTSFTITSTSLKGWKCLYRSPLSDICQWTGIKCTSNKVAQIVISGYSISGSIPSSLGDLKYLTYLDMSSNSLTGSIPTTISYLTALHFLYLQSNQLNGSLPFSMNKLISIQKITMQSNLFTGTIPTTMGSSLTTLNLLNLQYNKLSGTIPANLLTGYLQELYLNNNKLSGRFPNISSTTSDYVSISSNQRKYLKQYILRRRTATISIGNLNYLDFSGNALTGTIPSTIVYITGLQNLYLGNNQFTGTLCPELGKLNKLLVLNVSNNKLSGKIYGLVTGSSVSSLDISSNKFTGIVPLSLCGKSLAYIDFRNNTNIRCYSNCLATVNKLYSGSIHNCNSSTDSSSLGSSSSKSSISTTTIGLVTMGVVLFCLAVGGFIYYDRSIRRKIIFAFHQQSRKVAAVKLEDLIRPMIDDHTLFHGLLKLKTKEEQIPVDVIIIAKNKKKLHVEYEALFNLYQSNQTLCASLYGFVKEKKLSFASGASVSGLCGIAIERSKCTIESYLTSNSNDVDGILGKSSRVKRAYVGRALINIVNASIKDNVVLFGLRLDSLMCYGEEETIKLFFIPSICKIGSPFPEAYTTTVINPNLIQDIDDLRVVETTAGIEITNMIADVPVNMVTPKAAAIELSTYHIVVQSFHAMWILGVLLFELFVGRSLQLILSSDNNNDYSFTLSNLKQTDLDNLIDKYCSGAKNWLRRELLKKLLLVCHVDHKPNKLGISSYLSRSGSENQLNLNEYIEPDNFLEHSSESIIFYFIEKKVPEDILIQLLEEDPNKSSVINHDGLLPIQYAIEMNSYSGLLMKLIEYYPASVYVKFPPKNEDEVVGDNLIVRAMKLSLSDDHIRVLLPYYMPIDLEGNLLPVEDHQFAWARMVHHEKPADLYVETVRLTLQKFHIYVKTLAMCVDELSRSALNVATPLCKAEIVKILYFLGRYDFKPGVAHQSATCIVRLAVDTQLNRDVALKFMKHQDQFEREISVREKGGFDGDYVIGYLEAMDGDTDPVLREELTKKGFRAYNYCLIMIEADRSLQAVIAHEHIAGKDWEQIRVLCTQLTKAVHHIHSKGMIHGDIKPLNIMRVNGKLVLIDLDACVSFKDGDFAGAKYSSAYIPPEMVYLDNNLLASPPIVRSYGPKKVSSGVNTGREEEGEEGEAPLFELVKASPSYDMWSLGATLFQICSGKPLFLADNEDNISGDTLIELHDWTDKYKSMKMMDVTDPLARNLLSQLLHKDPERRISAERVLNHSFLTGKKATRLLGEEPEFDLFISYRVAADAAHVERIYNMLTANNVKVWWDKVCLEPGKPWEEGFCNGLAKCRAFVPMMSREALKSQISPSRQNFENLVDDSACDNVLLEYRLALEMRAMGLIELIFPVMVGDKGEDDVYSNYFKSGCHPSCKSVSVHTVEEKVREHLDRQGLGAPFSGFTTIDTVLSKLLENQGGFVEGPSEVAFNNVVTNIESMVKKSKLTSLTSKGSSKSIVVELDGLEDDELDEIKIQISNFARMRTVTSKSRK